MNSPAIVNETETQCSFCEEEAEEKYWEPEGRKPTCYAHCSVADDGKHVITDKSSVSQSSDDPYLFDVWCDNCGQSGSFGIVVDTDSVNWG